MRRMMPILAIVVVTLSASCRETSQPVVVRSGNGPSAEANSTSKVAPVIEIIRHQEIAFEPGIEMSVWSLSSSRVGAMTVRLLAMKNGESEVVHEWDCKWDEWPQSKPNAAWQLHYILQDGEAFGAPNKRLPGIALTFDDVAPSNIVKHRSTRFLEGEFRFRHTEARKDNTLDASRTEVIYYGFYDPTEGDTSVELSRTVEGLVEATKGGRTALAIVVDWEPSEGGE